MDRKQMKASKKKLDIEAQSCYYYIRIQGGKSRKKFPVASVEDREGYSNLGKLLLIPINPLPQRPQRKRKLKA